ncbi:O-linked N-acetylglucosamine transferase family protein [Halomonas sp. MES3-P3E]|uniref:O-linked N-acetylglucosamine transferase family protein n=1 Tax=Halomonas sp. MES3-P3E TaxID=2058321 RepID=UPI000C329DE7|nr:tetratricopeptide repeat protein [Halomonas sp. MES3-P3E]PKG54899.1 hypothetical protein CXF87_01000 [Halomonas sp. MES3-P3E]
MSKARRNPPRKSFNAAASPAHGELSLKQASKRVERAPNDPAGWKALGVHWLNQKRWDEAREPIEHALKLAPQDPEALEMLARVVHNQGDDIQAIALLAQAIELDFGFAQAHLSLSKIRFGRAENEQALDHIDQALTIQPRHLGMLSHRGNVLYRLHRYQDAIEVFDELLNKQPESYSHWNNAANLRRDLGLLDEADRFYRQSIERTTVDSKPYSNRLTALHYNPSISRNTILDVCREWEKRYGPAQAQLRPQPHNRAPNKRLRIGMISDGFRRHPVGRMITAALEKLATQEIALYAYSTNNAVDPLTVRIRKTTTQWLEISHLSDEALAQQIRDDEIDILIDLAGHNTGSRMRVIAMQPAPLLVKWVGGLINTTGLSAIDYLLTDSVESPEGEDPYYTEKLIRLPDDYICYDPSDVQAELQALPALRNGYITLGCFNNPSKLNEVVLAEWAEIMHQLPGSQLFLKGFQYSSEVLCQRVRDIMASHDIPATRLIIEGPSPHKELMEAYNRVDIALDPWPYSGGLTTCEAFFMGVPVVTLPGPTFAGRHSATHLVNAGMPELVVSSWDEYRERVIELASDLDSLSTIRSHLRDVLLQSPVCDAPRFAKHFTTAMRAIWQRYIEGKMPAALTLDKEGQAQFEDADRAVEILQAEPLAEEQDEFRWQLEGKVIAIDNGGKLISEGSIHRLRQLNAFGVVAFDFASRIQNSDQYQGSDDIQIFPHAVLGDGKPATLYACFNPALSSTLEPFSPEQQFVANAQDIKVLAKLPINSIALDSIEGLGSLDWLILDDLSDTMAILENGEKALKDTLTIQVRIAFQPTHKRQPNLAEVQHWMSRHGFRFYRFNNEQHRSHLPESVPEEQRQATELTSADALFLPSYERMAELSDSQRTKLSFLLHTVYEMRDAAYSVLKSMGLGIEENYWKEIVISEEDTVGGSSYFTQENISASMEHVPNETRKAAEKLNEALGDRELIFLGTGDMANHGIVQKVQATLLQQMKSLGINVSWANGQKPVPVEKILQLASSGKAVFYGSNRYYDADVSINGIDKKNLFDVLGTPLIACISDHPYTDFMMNRIANASKNGLLYGSQSLVDEVKFLRPDIKSVSARESEPAPTLIMKEPVDHSKREIDILVPMNLDYACAAESNYLLVLAEAKKINQNYHTLVARVVEEYNDFSKSLMDFYKECYREVFGAEWQPCTPWSQRDIVLIKLLGKIDDIVRGRKRLQAMSLIAKIAGDYNVVVLANEKVKSRLPKEIANSGNLQFIGTKNTATLEELYKKSRYILNVSPTYHDSIHERVRNAAAAGCAILSNKNKKLSETFGYKESILFYDDYDGLGGIVSKNKKESERVGASAKFIIDEINRETPIVSFLTICKDYLESRSSQKLVNKPTVLKSLKNSKIPDAPHMSAAERAIFKQQLQHATQYFEFGSGGSTVWAIKQGLTVKGVESDAKWVSSLRQELGERCKVEAVNIGPTREWGYPASMDYRELFSRYSNAIHQHEIAFDLILVDGRFRVACTIASIQHILRQHANPHKARIFIHDFWDRPIYHCVLNFLDPLERADTAGVFKIKEGVKNEDLQRVWKEYAERVE